MSFKTLNTADVPAFVFIQALRAAAQLKREAQNYRVLAVAGSVRLADIETGLLSILRDSKIVLEKAQATPNMVAYAQAQFEAGYDIATEFTAMMGEISTLLTWLENNFPTDAGGHLQSRTFVSDGSGKTQSALLTDATALTALIARLDALIATID